MWLTASSKISFLGMRRKFLKDSNLSLRKDYQMMEMLGEILDETLGVFDHLSLQSMNMKVFWDQMLSSMLDTFYQGITASYL